MTSSAAVDRQRASVCVLGDMRRCVHRSQFIDEIFGVVGFVSAQRDRVRSAGARLDHVQRRDPFHMPVGLGHTGVDQKPVPVLDQACLMKQSFASLPGLLR